MTVLGLLILLVLFWIGYEICGVFLYAMLWMCIKLPLGLFFMGIGLALCCTILLIPIGYVFLKFGGRLIVPGGRI